MSEFCHKPGEFSLESGVKYRISGRFGRFKKYDIETDRGKSLKSFNLLRNNFSQSILRIEENIRLSLLPNKGVLSPQLQLQYLQQELVS